MYPLPIKQLINSFTKLPSIGQRTAERFVFYLLKSGKKNVAELINALKNLIDNIESCKTCWDFSDKPVCGICSNPKRDKTTICVVDQPQAVQVFEKTGEYSGVYHVLRGTIESDNENGIQYLKVKELLTRAKGAKEIILALNPDLNGETTMMFLEKKLRETSDSLKITKLARGLPIGSDLQYADEITLNSALKNRT